MKKYIWISLLFLVGCGSRKSTVAISKEKIEATENTDVSQEIESSTKTESTFDFSKFMEDQNIIFDGGKEYTLSYNGLTYTGSNKVEIYNKKEQTKIITTNKIETEYRTLTNYQTQTTYKSQSYHKAKETERKAYPFWLWIAVGFFLQILVGLAWKSFKGSNAYFKIFKNTI